MLWCVDCSLGMVLRSTDVQLEEFILLLKKRFGLIAMALCMAFVTVVFQPANVLGQAISVNGGSIQGTITDQSGAIIPNAEITVTNPETGLGHSTPAPMLLPFRRPAFSY
jgi:hypothetical protein